MCHLIIPLLLAFLYEVAAFPPNKLYVSIADSARPVSSGLRGDIPWKADHCGILLKLDTSNKNFKAFAKKFDLKVEDWKDIPYDPFEDTFTILHHGHRIVLRPSTEPFPPKPQAEEPVSQ
ncbi:hypothetical protein FOZ62_013454 [Perkinsus olseni]|uniref:Uncharacterized protein n=1 Tax=Perkinsus olseni TaxID=32597 RepID=A0A7J6SJJ2_PEROL|nr:hypothetical protein FOZ62_013454 [Perkinsus olseni]